MGGAIRCCRRRDVQEVVPLSGVSGDLLGRSRVSWPFCRASFSLKSGVKSVQLGGVIKRITSTIPPGLERNGITCSWVVHAAPRGIRQVRQMLVSMT